MHFGRGAQGLQGLRTVLLAHVAGGLQISALQQGWRCPAGPHEQGGARREAAGMEGKPGREHPEM